MNIQWFSLALLLCLSSAHAQNVVFSEPQIQQATLENGVSFKLQTQTYKAFYPADPSQGMWEDGYNYGTATYAEYRTPNMQNLEKYAIVQFIRGCMFYNYTGKNPYSDFFKTKSFGIDNVDFDFPNWVVDSGDSDPMYMSVGTNEMQDWGNSRHGRYYWNKDANSFAQKTEVIYADDKKLNTPRLYIMDHPSTAFAAEKIERNQSLEFQTCLYKTADIPLKTTPSGMDPKKALKCFGWSSSFIYNKKTRNYESPKGIHEFCLENHPKKLGEDNRIVNTNP